MIKSAREIAKAILSMSETSDEKPPYRCLPSPGIDSVWMKLKIERVENALTQYAKEVTDELRAELEEAKKDYENLASFPTAWRESRDNSITRLESQLSTLKQCAGELVVALESSKADLEGEGRWMFVNEEILAKAKKELGL